MILHRCDTWRNPIFERPQATAGIELASNDTECATPQPDLSRAALLGRGSESTSRYHQHQKKQLGACDGTSWPLKSLSTLSSKHSVEYRFFSIAVITNESKDIHAYPPIKLRNWINTGQRIANQIRAEAGRAGSDNYWNIRWITRPSEGNTGRAKMPAFSGGAGCVVSWVSSYCSLLLV